MEGLDNHNNEQPPKVVVVMVPALAQGHLNQLLHLSHLITTYRIPVHFAGSSTHNRQAKVRLQGWDSKTLTNIQFHDFQLPSYNSPPPNIDLDTSSFPQHLVPLFEASTHLRHPVSQLLQQLSENFERVVVIHDTIMAHVIQDVNLIPNAETYTFNPISAFTTFVQDWESIPEEHKPFKLDPNDVPDHLPTDEYMFMSPEMMEFIVNQIKLLGSLKSSWIYNTSRVIEGRYVQLIESMEEDVKHFALGPFNPVHINETKGGEKNRHSCLEWLDEQEKNSVIYVSFGSTVSMKDDQIDELAKGLEDSGVKFIWVLRGADPNDVFKEGDDEVIRPKLLEGYEERVKGKGMVVREWAPQLEILGHPSVGGFMSHCGWNSCMESISMGVPILAWPMHSDQPRNAILISEVLKIGMVVRKWSRCSELVRSSTIENAVKTLMGSEEGNEMKERAVKLSEEVKGSIVENGVSCLERDAFIAYITR